MEKMENFNKLENRVLNLLDQLENYKNILKSAENSLQEIEKLQKKVSFLKDDSSKLRNKLRETQANNLHLNEEVKRLKIVNAMSGNQEYKQMMKQRMNKLIKEVDTCITQIKMNN